MDAASFQNRYRNINWLKCDSHRWHDKCLKFKIPPHINAHRNNYKKWTYKLNQNLICVVFKDKTRDCSEMHEFMHVAKWKKVSEKRLFALKINELITCKASLFKTVCLLISQNIDPASKRKLKIKGIILSKVTRIFFLLHKNTSFLVVSMFGYSMCKWLFLYLICIFTHLPFRLGSIVRLEDENKKKLVSARHFQIEKSN